MPLILPQTRPKLIRPSTEPRFNARHPLSDGISAGVGFSGVSVGGAFRSLLTGRISSHGTQPTSGINPFMGRVSSFSASNGGGNFSGNATAAISENTVSAIVSWTSGLGVIFATASGNSGIVLYVETTGVLTCYALAGSYGATGITLSSGIPYFVSVSANGSASNQVAVRLDTGQMYTATPTSSLTFTTMNGTYIVGNDVYGRTGLLSLAAVQFTPRFKSLAQLRAAAADPWSMWYS